MAGNMRANMPNPNRSTLDGHRTFVSSNFVCDRKASDRLLKDSSLCMVAEISNRGKYSTHHTKGSGNSWTHRASILVKARLVGLSAMTLDHISTGNTGMP